MPQRGINGAAGLRPPAAEMNGFPQILTGFGKVPPKKQGQRPGVPGLLL